RHATVVIASQAIAAWLRVGHLTVITARGEARARGAVQLVHDVHAVHVDPRFDSRQVAIEHVQGVAGDAEIDVEGRVAVQVGERKAGSIGRGTVARSAGLVGRDLVDQVRQQRGQVRRHEVDYRVEAARAAGAGDRQAVRQGWLEGHVDV